MNQPNRMTTEELREKAITLVLSMTDEQADLVYRVLSLGDEAINALLASGCQGYDKISAFVNEWEKGAS